MVRLKQQDDKQLGLDRNISRRDFLNGALLGAGALCVSGLSPQVILSRDLTGDGVDRRWSGNTEQVFTAGHAVRDGKYSRPDLPSQDSGEVFDLVVVGGGLSGLAAAYYFSKEKVGKTLILENHNELGGNARRDEFQIKGTTLYAPQGSVVAQDLPPQFVAGPPIDTLFDELGINLKRIQVPKEQSDFTVFWDSGSPAKWYTSLFEAPVSDNAKKDLMAFFGTVMTFYKDPEWRQKLKELDRYTFKDYVASQKWIPEVYNLLSPDLASFFGFPDMVSAGMVYAQYGGGPPVMYSFPGGNSGFLRHLLKKVNPDAIHGGSSSDEIIRGSFVPQAMDRPSDKVRVRLGSTVVRVEQSAKARSSHVAVTYSAGGKLFQVHAKGVVMAGGGYITKHVVRDIPSQNRTAYDSFQYSPVLWINVAVNNSRAIDKAGVNFMSTYHDGFGVMMLIYDKMSAAVSDRQLDPSRPNVIGIGAPRFYPGLSPREQAVKGRHEILATSFQEYERKIREELNRLLGPWGFDAKKDIEAIAISRWGHHGYVFPYPGIFTDGSVEAARKPFGRITFAHTDLDRYSHIVGALRHGQRAVHELMESM